MSVSLKSPLQQNPRRVGIELTLCVDVALGNGYGCLLLVGRTGTIVYNHYGCCRRE